MLGAVLDGIPGSVVLGVSLIGGGAFSLPMLLAVFISIVPEAPAVSADLERGGLPRGRILVSWSVVALASTAAAALGFATAAVLSAAS
jgi:ZIP family zinc transporter